jgi:hypothetical protein
MKIKGVARVNLGFIILVVLISIIVLIKYWLT